MAIEIVPYEAIHEPMMARFNERMAAAGSGWGFYGSHRVNWISKTAASNPTVWREYYVAIEDGTELRGAYCLKPQKFLLKGEEAWVGSWQGPVSEGLINRRYFRLALQFMSHMEERLSHLFVWGGSDRLLELLKSFQWRMIETPAYLRVLHGGRFVRNIKPLRSSTRNRLLLDIAALTGVATLGFLVIQRRKSRPVTSVKIVPRFGFWADEIWSAAREHYDMIAFRDAGTLNHLMVDSEWPKVEIAKVFVLRELVGWAAIRAVNMKDDSRFGNMRVGSIIDCLALPGKESAVIAAAMDLLEDRNVDVITTNMTHSAWATALRSTGFLAIKNRRTFCLTPSFVAKLETNGIDIPGGVHLTPIDGDGPHGL